MLFFFIVEKFNRYSIKTSKTVAQTNRVQIFKNTFSNDFFHDFNFFTFTAFKHVRKHFLNNITVNTINKSTKTFKTIKKKSLNKKNKFYVSRNSRVDFYATFYFFTFSLFFYIATRKLRNRHTILFLLIFTFFYSFFCYNLLRFLLFNFFRFRFTKKKRKTKKKSRNRKTKTKCRSDCTN